MNGGSCWARWAYFDKLSSAIAGSRLGEQQLWSFLKLRPQDLRVVWIRCAWSKFNKRVASHLSSGIWTYEEADVDVDVEVDVEVDVDVDADVEGFDSVRALDAWVYFAFDVRIWLDSLFIDTFESTSKCDGTTCQLRWEENSRPSQGHLSWATNFQKADNHTSKACIFVPRVKTDCPVADV